ncbi:GNAT family N-acetyltransferase [Bacillus piscicola]|uniref:GNAT family N-acetyltransferase n=1 Tax=Bacillus piscicola TaxID=1632684 RepID=UPI001F099AAD
MIVIEADNQREQEEAYLIRHKVFVDEQNVPEHLEIDEHESDAYHFVLYDKDKPMGAARLRVVEGTGKAERVCVLSSCRKNGAGRLLMEALEKKVTALGFDTMTLHAQLTAVPFYKKLRYSVTSDQFMDAGIPHVEMKKTLPRNGGRT